MKKPIDKWKILCYNILAFLSTVDYNERKTNQRAISTKNQWYIIKKTLVNQGKITAGVAQLVEQLIRKKLHSFQTLNQRNTPVKSSGLPLFFYIHSPVD